MKRLLIAIAGCAIPLTGCRGEAPTPAASPSMAPSVSAPASPATSGSPTPSGTAPTLTPAQQQALDAADHHWRELDKILRKGSFNGTAIIKALRPTATDPVIQSNLNAARRLWKAGHHLVGSKTIITRKAARPQDGNSQVTVTFCQDQDVALADKKGRIVARPYPAHLVISYDMRKIKGAFKVYSAESREVTKC